jgi:hypothetical protein
MLTITTRAALLAVLLFPLQLSAQPVFEGFWSALPNAGEGGRELLDKLPADAVFINDAGAGELGKGEYSGLQLSAEAQAEVEAYDFANELSREYACTPPSVAFYMQAPFPMEIHQDKQLLVFRMEYYDMVRVIFLDGRGHPPADAPHSKNGHSIGHWEGDELVIDTTHISSGTFMNNGFNHSDDIHLVERYRLSPDGRTLYASQVTEDPQVFSGKAARFIAWRKVDGEYVYPYDCDPSFGD